MSNGMTSIPYEVLDAKNKRIRELTEENMMLHRRINGLRMQIDMQRNKDLPELLTLEKVAEFFQISPTAARKMIVSGQIPAVQLCRGGKWYVPTQKLMDRIEELMIQPQEEMPV